MDKKKILAAGAAAVALSPVVVSKAFAATETVPMQAIVLQAIQLNTLSSLNFGTFSQPGGADTVVVSAAGAATNYNTLNPVGAPVDHDGVVEIKATKGFPIVISAPAADTIANGANNMAVNAFLINDAAGMATFASAQVVTATLTANTATFNVGATLHVGAAQPAGTYTGSFTVTASYQ